MKQKTERVQMHTPGPWNIHREINVIGPDGSSVLGKTSNSDPTVLDEVKANARLIAAAPELLEACQYVWGLLRELEYEKAPVTYANVQQIYDRLNAAISKATEAR